ncbi:MAG: MFS transporter, partial [Bdellovibrio sp.]
LSDKWGRRPIILISLLGAGVSHLIFAFGTNLWVLFLARGLAGVFGANISTAMAYIADITPPKDRSKGMGLIGAAFGLGFMLGPFIGGIAGQIGPHLGSNPPLGEGFAALVASIICFANFLFAYSFLAESISPEVKQHHKKRPPRLKKIIEYLKIPLMPSLMGSFFLGILAMANMEAALFLFVKDDFSWSVSQASYGFAYVGLIMVFTQGYLIRKVTPLWGERNVLVIGTTLLSLGLLGIGLSSSLAPLAISVTTLAVGNGLMHPSATGSISLIAPKDDQGGVMGANQSLSAMGRIIGPAIGGYLYEISHPSPFLLGSAFTFLALLIILSVWKKLPDTRGIKKQTTPVSS